ncbi:hypothetical protein AG1IA_06743 [Rhizoctonia solani AG-1 IA]|uniref:Uncharacterized protein n=1 Tax=Thanatephorus cucumeris (strain AG1-IA) TaxID=983506 RepID=L8WR51_THACA|nr:hypothetical protein AG1IA_06743 [Rhizoctonia solani AG-1 IA]
MISAHGSNVLFPCKDFPRPSRKDSSQSINSSISFFHSITMYLESSGLSPESNAVAHTVVRVEHIALFTLSILFASLSSWAVN